MLNIFDSLGDEIFEWVDYSTGDRAFFNATKIWEWALDHIPEVELLMPPLDEQLKELVFNKRGIEQWKIDRLCEPYLSQPALGVLLRDGTTIHIDGNHRLARWFMRGDTEHLLIRVSWAQAEPFTIEGIPAGAILGT